MFNSLWMFRGFVLSSVKREFQSKYRNSLLGVAWTVLNPLAMIVIYTVVFSRVMRAKMPGVDSTFAYSIYLCTGIIMWGLFDETIRRSQGIFLDNANLIKKISFPRICLPVIVVLNAGLNFVIIFSLFVGFLVLSGNFPGWIFLAVFPVLILQIVFSIGLGITLGVLNVFFRDVGQLMSIVLQFWFWLTPIVYPSTILPKKIYVIILLLNPMAALINAYQNIFLHGTLPEWKALLPATLISIVFSVLAMRLFRKHAGEMVDEL